MTYLSLNEVLSGSGIYITAGDDDRRSVSSASSVAFCPQKKLCSSEKTEMWMQMWPAEFVIWLDMRVGGEETEEIIPPWNISNHEIKNSRPPFIPPQHLHHRSSHRPYYS